ncbi:hypothetical protein J3E64_004057 [Sphingobium sp. OAS761]|nr:hypothetical protein [Sphingobium sp. OAS761]
MPRAVETIWPTAYSGLMVQAAQWVRPTANAAIGALDRLGTDGWCNAELADLPRVALPSERDLAPTCYRA